MLRFLADERFEVESAGIEPGEINPLAAEILKEVGIDISSKKTQSVFDLFNEGKEFDHIITVCDESNAAKCPVFPGIKSQIHWSFEDPSRFEGTQDEKLNKVRLI